VTLGALKAGSEQEAQQAGRTRVALSHARRSVAVVTNSEELAAHVLRAAGLLRVKLLAQLASRRRRAASD